MENNVHILIVEDSPTQAVQLQYLLEKKHYQVTVAKDGEQALEMLKKIKPTIIISDIVMPKMNGYDLCKVIKENDRLKDIPVILLTSLSDPEDVINGLSCGANNFIVKPYDDNFLISRIKYILANMEIRKSAGSQMGIEIIFRGKRYFLTSERVQMIDLLLSTYEAAIQRNLAFQTANEQLQQARDELERRVQERTFELGQRVKELKCLYAISSLAAEPGSSIEGTLKVAVDYIPPAFHYPDITCARISFEGQEFTTPNFKETPWKLSEEITIAGEKRGAVEGFFLEKRPELDDGPFFKEEQHLLKDVARQLVLMIERERAKENERHLSVVLWSIRNINKLIVGEKDPARLIQSACENLIASRGFLGAWIVLTESPSTEHMEVAFSGYDEAAFNPLIEVFRKGELPACCRPSQTEGGVIVTEAPLITCKNCPLATSYAGKTPMTVDLRYNEQIYGWLSVSVPSEFAADPEEASLLREIAHDIGFALHGIEVEAERKRSEDTIRAIFESASDGILLADVESGGFVMGNDAICRMLGLSAEEIKGLSITDIHPIESLDYVRSQFEKQASGEISLASDIPVKRKDGSIFPADVNSASLHLDGRPHLLGIFRDITMRKEAERVLEEAFDIINKSSSVAFTWKNQDGMPVEFVSENVEKLFGYTAQEFMTGEVNYTDCIHSNDLERVIKEVAEFSGQAETTEFFHEPYRIIAKNGSEKIISSWTFIVRDNDGSITHYKGIVEDITERRLLEEQVRQSQKMEAIGTLAGGIAHDFNNILTTIIGTANLALTEVDKDSPFREDFSEIRKAGDRAASLTRQLLAFSRKQIIQPKNLNLNDVLEDVEKMIDRLIGEDIELTMIQRSELWQVKADPSQIEQIIMNLTANARDAMSGGGILTIETANLELDEVYFRHHGIKEGRPGAYVMLAVSDTGVGMDKEIQKHLFEPFFTTKEIGRGTGLGLSTVYGIVQQNKGLIWVYSEPGQGSTFKIYFPRVEENVSSERQEASSVVDLGGSETILIIEDDDSLRALVLNILKRKGYKILEAENGEDAIEVAEAHDGPIDLMITDVVMPKMGGQEVAKLLKQHYPHIKVIYMSGYTDSTIANHGILETGLNFVQKPFTPEVLAGKVREILNLK